ncbi:hypothetical protein Ancab_038195 [Ancistrocladus abbreviatus]
MTASPSPSPPSVQVKDKIDLTEKETQIFNRLLEILRHLNLSTQLRVAGGLVRDKRFGTAEEDAYRGDLTINRHCCSEIWEDSDSFALKGNIFGRYPMCSSSSLFWCKVWVCAG